MNSRIRVGDVIYNDKKKVVAVFMHGSWCSERSIYEKGSVQNEDGTWVAQSTDKVIALELVPVDSGVAKEYSCMKDALKLKMEAGEMQIVQMAEHLISEEKSSQIRNLALECVRDGVLRGLSKFGPFDPVKETRNLNDSIRGCLQNAMVYCCMLILVNKDAPIGNIKDVFIRCARDWMMLR